MCYVDRKGGPKILHPVNENLLIVCTFLLYHITCILIISPVPITAGKPLHYQVIFLCFYYYA